MFCLQNSNKSFFELFISYLFIIFDSLYFNNEFDRIQYNWNKYEIVVKNKKIEGKKI
jgi:hypothetical protein